VLGVLVAALVGVGLSWWSSASRSTVGELRFANELRVPPLAEPKVSEPGRKVFDLSLEQGRTDLLPGKPAETRGRERALPGPDAARRPGRRGHRGRLGQLVVHVDAELVRRDAPEPRAGTHVRRFELGNRDNGMRMDLARIDEVVELGASEVWEVENTSGTPHNFHPHDVRFDVLEYAGAPPPPSLCGRKADRR
jgi:Multicopper oxidase